MLRITQSVSAAAAKKYYSTADYYTEGQEIVGSWGGEAAKKLGLEGIVDQQLFERMCDNRHPFTNQKLTVRDGSERTVGYDFTWSVPKSVSLMYALTGDQTILEAFRESVRESMQEIEREMKTRVRINGRDENRTTGNMVWAEFIHTTSRPVQGVPDPQLHSHCFVFNTTFDEKENRWKAGQFRDLKRDAPYFQAAFRARLAGKLQDLGFTLERKRDDFEVAGISKEVIKRFSRRTDVIEGAYRDYLAEKLVESHYVERKEDGYYADQKLLSDEDILALAEQYGLTNDKVKDELGAETRESKSSRHSWNQLRQIWDAKLSREDREAMAEVHRRESPSNKPEPQSQAAVDYALAHVFKTKTTATEREVLTHALKRYVDCIDVTSVQQELSLRSLIRARKGDQVLITTPKVHGLEVFVKESAQEGRGRYQKFLLHSPTIRRDWLNEGQRRAVEHVWASRDFVTLIRGAAGTGKTSMMSEAIDGLEAAGRHVTVLAPTVSASHEVLRDEGFREADTVARFLKDPKMQEKARGQIIWVDEASMMGTEEMAKLFQKAQDLGARIVLSGDRFQHRAVAQGEPLRLLEQRAGLPVAEITEIMRQKPQDYRRAVEFLSRGDTAAGLDLFEKMGKIREIAGEERDVALSQAYLAAVKEKKKNGENATALVVSPTHSEGNRIAEMIRSQLKKAGRIKGEVTLSTWKSAGLSDPQKGDRTLYESGDMIQFHQNAPGHKSGSRQVLLEGQKLPLEVADRFELFKPSSLTIGRGDRIRITHRGQTQDGKHLLARNALFTVQKVTPRGDLIVDHGWVIDKDFGHITQGYTVTSHASEGKTVDRVFIGQSSESFPASNRRQIYVSASRARQEAVIFTDDIKQLAKAVRRADEPMSAIELEELARQQATTKKRRHKRLARNQRSFNLTRQNELHRDQFAQTRQPEVTHER